MSAGMSEWGAVCRGVGGVRWAPSTLCECGGWGQAWTSVAGERKQGVGEASVLR